MTHRGDVYRRNLTLNTISSLACVGGSGAKGQSEHGSVEMPVGWTMSFPQPLLKDRALPPADKTFRLNAGSCGSQLSWGFPNRPCGQEFHPFPDSSWKFHSFFFFSPVGCCLFHWDVFQASVTAMKGASTSGSSFAPKSFPITISCMLRFENQTQGPSYLLISADSFPITPKQLNPQYSLIIRLVVFHPLSRQDKLITDVRGSQRWRHYNNFIIHSSHIMLRYRTIIGRLDQRPEHAWDIFIQKSILYIF